MAADASDLASAFAKLVQAGGDLPEVEQSTWYGTPSLKVRKKSFCRVKDADTVVLLAALEEKELLLQSAPDIYYETPHYHGWPAMLVRIHQIEAVELRLRLQRAWERVAPRALLKIRSASQGPS